MTLHPELHPERSRPLRIAFVTETFPPEINGVALTIARLIEGLAERRHDVRLVRLRQPGDAAPPTSGTGEERGPLLMRGMPIPRYPELRMGLPCRRALVRRWSVQRPDVVHIATEGLLGRSALQAATALGLPVSSDFRTNFHAYSRHYGVGWLCGPIRAYLRRFHNATGCTMVPTQALHDQLAEAGFRNLAVVARGVDVRRFSPAHRSDALRAAWGAGPDDLVVACVGRLAPEKNLATLVDAFEAIRRHAPRAKLLLVGDGPMRRELAARCPDAVFAGQRTGHDLALHYASADLFLFPSVTETFGNVTAEAMASGLPVVAFDYAAAARLVEPGVNGTLVPFGDDAAFVERALAAAADPARGRAFGARACASMQALDWSQIVLQFEQVLDGVIRAGAARAPYALTSAPQLSA